MSFLSWDPIEAGKQANIAGQLDNKKLQQEQEKVQKDRSDALNRRLRVHSVVRPAMYPIKTAAQQFTSQFNAQLSDATRHTKLVVYEDNGGMGLNNIPSAFCIISGPRRINVIPNYAEWQITVQTQDQIYKTYQVNDEPVGSDRIVFYLDTENNRRVNAEDIARLACQYAYPH